MRVVIICTLINIYHFNKNILTAVDEIDGDESADWLIINREYNVVYYSIQILVNNDDWFIL